MNSFPMNSEYAYCFACGKANEIGLKLNFYYQKNGSYCDFSVGDRYEGYQGMVHGGIVSTILDETMAKVILQKKIAAVTAELHVKFRKPLVPQTMYRAHGEIVGQKKRIISVKAEITDEEGAVYAQAEAIFFVQS